MSIKQRLEADAVTALKGGDKLRVTCLRMLRSRILEKEVALRAKEGRDYELTDEQSIEVVAAYAKQRRDSIDSYREAQREDLVTKEEAELAIVSEYLPRQLAEDELRGIVREVIEGCGATSMKDLGAVMKALMPRVKGLADGKIVNRIVRDLLP